MVSGKAPAVLQISAIIGVCKITLSIFLFMGIISKSNILSLPFKLHEPSLGEVLKTWFEKKYILNCNNPLGEYYMCFNHLLEYYILFYEKEIDFS